MAAGGALSDHAAPEVEEGLAAARRMTTAGSGRGGADSVVAVDSTTAGGGAVGSDTATSIGAGIWLTRTPAITIRMIRIPTMFATISRNESESERDLVALFSPPHVKCLADYSAVYVAEERNPHPSTMLLSR